MGNKREWKCNICQKPIFINKNHLCKDCFKQQQDDNKLKIWLETGNPNCKIGSTIRNCIRTYIYNRQNYRCAICNLPNEWNNKKLNFILDHIDGNASNNNSNNLRLICPNCDSQLPTYKSKNKNSARKYR